MQAPSTLIEAGAWPNDSYERTASQATHVSRQPTNQPTNKPNKQTTKQPKQPKQPTKTTSQPTKQPTKTTSQPVNQLFGRPPIYSSVLQGCRAWRLSPTYVIQTGFPPADDYGIPNVQFVLQLYNTCGDCVAGAAKLVWLVLCRAAGLARTGVVLTIHNIAFQVNK